MCLAMSWHRWRHEFPCCSWPADRDAPSKDAVQSVQQAVQRTRLNKVELFPSSLHGYKFLRLEPKVTSAVFQFLDASLKNRPIEWEPQYNLTPVTFSDPQIVLNTRPSDSRKDQSKANEPVKKAAAPVPNKRMPAPTSLEGDPADKNNNSPRRTCQCRLGPRNPTDPTR